MSAPGTASSPPGPLVRIGFIGCGEIAQVVHLHTLGHLSPYFRITYLCDVSKGALEHCKAKIPGAGPATTTDPAELCNSPDVDIVFVINSDAYHAEHAILALRCNKHVFIEKPAALNLRDLQRVQDAEAASKGRVMVGYMRRFAAAFQKAKELVGGLDKILYARVRDIVGPNSTFVGQSGTFPQKFADITQPDSDDLTARTNEIVSAGLAECGVAPTPKNQRAWRLLGSLGSHDLSAMRELLGMPTGVVGASFQGMFWNAIFQYPDFNVVYESGIDNIPRFDAHIEVISDTKSVKIQYDTPYVKGLPTNIYIAEDDNGVYKETTLRVTYEDSYTQEMMEMYEWYTKGKDLKTTVSDSKDDITVFGMVMGAL